MECRLPSKREEIKHNPETTDATETVCSWRTLVWRQAACGQKYLRGWMKTFCHLTYLSPTPHRKFQELKVAVTFPQTSFPRLLYTSLRPYPPLLKAFSVFWSRYGPHLWMHSFSKVLDPCTQPPRCCCCFFFCSHISLRCSHDLNAWNRLGSLKKGFLARADLIFGKSQKSHEPSRMSIVDVPSTGCHCHQGTSVC